MANLDQILNYIVDNMQITIEEIETPAFNISAGTIGTSGGSVSVDISKTGKTPIAVWLARHSHPGNYNANVRWKPGDSNATVQAYRASSAAVTVTKGDTYVAVAYISRS